MASYQKRCNSIANTLELHLFCIKPSIYILANPIELDMDSTLIYHQTCNIRHSIVGNKFVDHTDVVGALPVGTAPTTSSFSA